MHNKTSPMDMRRIAVVGVGNILCRDEGLGIYVIRRLEKLKLPDVVTLHDCGTSGIAVLEAIDGASKAIIVDAVSMGGEPGKIYRLTLDDILSMEHSLFKMVSLHQFDLISTLKFAQFTDVYRIPKDLIIIGVEGAEFHLDIGLSDEVSKAIPKIIEYILDEISKSLNP